jgi:hypothetical protein
MKQSPSLEANRFSASQEIPRILWNLKVYCRVLKCPPPVRILSQLSLVHTPTSHFLKIHLNIILYNPTCLSSPPLTLHAPPLSFSRFYHPNELLYNMSKYVNTNYLVTFCIEHLHVHSCSSKLRLRSI